MENIGFNKWIMAKNWKELELFYKNLDWMAKLFLHKEIKEDIERRIKKRENWTKYFKEKIND